MTDNDIIQFTAVWTAASEVYNVSLTDAAVTLAFKVLSQYDIAEIQQAVSSYLADPELGRFPPKPADIVKQITDRQNNDGRPEADEAWAIAIQSFDEAATVILNDEISGALEYSGELYSEGDKVAARMAFKATYEKLVSEARAEKKPLKWFPSLGTDVHQRKPAIDLAVEKGLLTKSHVEKLLPAPITNDGMKLLAGAGKMIGSKLDQETIIKRLNEMKEALK